MSRSTKIFGVLAVVLLLFFLFILYSVQHQGFSTLDHAVNGLPSVNHGLFFSLSVMMHYLFATESMVVITFLLALFLWLQRRKKEASLLAIVMVVDAAILFFLKQLIHRERPVNALIRDSGFAFPSGHTTTAVVFFGLMLFFILRHVHSVYLRRVFVFLCLGMMLMIGASRLYLKAHWFTDVLGGFILGTFVLFTSLLTFQKLEH